MELERCTDTLAVVIVGDNARLRRFLGLLKEMENKSCVRCGELMSVVRMCVVAATTLLWK